MENQNLLEVLERCKDWTVLQFVREASPGERVTLLAKFTEDVALRHADDTALKLFGYLMQAIQD